MATSIGVKLKMDGESEFRRGLNNIVNSTKNLDKQLDTLERSFDDEKKSMEQNAKQTELLERKKENLEKQIQQMNTALEYARDNYEENSNEVTSWEAALASAEEQLTNVNEQLEECTEFQEETSSAYQELTETIGDQEAELAELRDAYIDAVLEFGEGSDEAQELAGQISNLSGELQANKGRLDEAIASADSLASSYDSASSSAEAFGGESISVSEIFGGKIGEMASVMETHDIAGLIGLATSALKECGETVIDTAADFIEAQDEMVIATGLTGDALDDLNQSAKNVYYGNLVTNQSLGDVSAAMSELYTRLGMTGTEANYMTTLFEKYADVLGVSGVSSVDSYSDALYQWNLVSDDSTRNMAYMQVMMEEITLAQSMSKASTQELEAALSDNAGQYQALGLSITDTLAMIVAYNQAGGNTSELTSGVSRAVRELSDTTNDVPGAFQSMIDSMSSATSVSEGLNMEVGDTGKTIEDILGKRAATAMVNTFMNGKVQTDTYRDALIDANGTIETFYNETRTAEDYMAKLWDWGNKSTAYDNVTKWIEDIGKKLLGTGEDADELKNKASSAASEMESDFSRVRSELSTPIRMSVSAPAIAYYSSGSGKNARLTPYNSGTYTFARAYDEAMILNSPTIFGASGNNLLVGGDRAGNEIVVGENHLLDMFESTMQKVMSSGGNSTSNDIDINVYGAEGQNVNTLAQLIADKIQAQVDRRNATYA